MITVSGVIYGLLAAIVGTLFLVYTFQIVGFTGRQDWIEKYLGSGTTYLAYKLCGLILVAGGILAATGLLHGAIAFVFSPLQHLFNQGR
jgi:hypothetical protein